MKITIAEILINRPSKHLNRTFSYRIPKNLNYINIGWRCVVPFGKHKEEGIVISIREIEENSVSYKVLDIENTIDSYNWFSDSMMQLAYWISSYYLCTLLDALRLFLIDKKGIKKDISYFINWDIIPENHKIKELIDISVKTVRKDAIEKILSKNNIQEYINKQFFSVQEIYDSTYKRPLDKWIKLNNTDINFKLGPKQFELKKYLDKNKEASVDNLKEKGFSSSVINAVCDKNIAKYFYKYRKTFSLIKDTIKKKDKKILTDEQNNVLKNILKKIKENKYSGILLKGVTGSGKTEVYLRATENVLLNNGTVLILVPEISMTDQIISYFTEYFGSNIVFMHSNLNKSERYNNRMRIQNGEARIIIGSRSALFMPFNNLKLIIVDEEYDFSYKQSDGPRYHGRDVAKMLAVIHNCPIILGAATPSISTYNSAENKQIDLLEMNYRIHKTPLPKINIIDMQDEYLLGNYSLFSGYLLKKLKDTKTNNKKSILFLNRRGFFTYLICTKCGNTVKCQHCDVSLVYHKDKKRLQCHSCEKFFDVITICPKCSNKLIYKGFGTQRIEDEIHKYLPELKCKRLDIDSISKKGSSAQILNDFRSGLFDVLLGTQLVTKGHDIPDVKTVGILNADGMLNTPGYLSAENTFNTLTQCAGRAGRNKEQGEVILQTYNPSHYVIQSIAKHNYEEFYRKEIEYRKALFYPPFSKLIKISSFNKIYEKALYKANRIYKYLSQNNQNDVIIVPPYDENLKKIRDKYYISILIKGKNLSSIKTIIRNSFISEENDIIIDVDPIY